MGSFFVSAGRVGATSEDRVAGRRRVPVKEIVERVGVTKPTVIAWKKRYAAEGIGGLGRSAQAGAACTS